MRPRSAVIAALALGAVAMTACASTASSPRSASRPAVGERPPAAVIAARDSARPDIVGTGSQRDGAAAAGLPAALRDSLSTDLAPVLHSVRGEATYYADRLEGRRTASGSIFRQDELVAAHRGFPFGTLLRVTNVRNRRSVLVRVVDRGPWGARAAARNTIVDLSRSAARQLGYLSQGRAQVKVDVLEWGPGA